VNALRLLRIHLARAAVALFLLFFVVQPGTADAAPSLHRRTVVLRLDFEGVSEVGKDQLAQRLFQGLAAAGFQVFSADEVVTRLFAETPNLKACADAACFMQIASALQANYLVIGAVSARSRNYEINLRLIHGRTGQKVAESNERCEICGIEEASETLDLAASALRAGLEQVEAPAQVTIESRPQGALVAVDKNPVGFAPLTLDMTMGVHDVELSLAGYKRQSRSVEVQPGTSQNLSFDLETEPRPFTGKAWKIAGWVAVSVGVLAIAGGAFALSKHNDVVSCDDLAGKCTYYETRLPAAALLSLGGAAVGFGGLALVVANTPEPAAPVPPTSTSQAVAGSAWQFAVRGRF
jgi:hypothetical protein